MSQSYEKRWYGVGVLSIILVIISIDNTVLDIALPSISNTLGASASDLQWLIDIYILVFTSLLLTSGAIGDRYGRVMMLQIGVVVFGIASLGAALSTNIDMLILYRGLTGVGAAMMMPSTLSIITEMFRDKDERAKAIAIWSMMFGVGFGFGPLLGGWLVDNYGWQSVFYINIPIVFIAFILGFLWLRESFDKSTPKADFIGMILSIIGMFSLVYAIIEAGMLGWSDIRVVQYFIVASISISIFIYYEIKIIHPMIPLILFTNPSFWVASLALTLAMFGIMGTMFFFSQLFQTLQGYSALDTGFLLVPLTVGLMITSGYAPKLVKIFTLKSVTSVGMLVSALSIAYFAYYLSIDVSKWIIMFGFFMLGAGFGVAMTPATDSIMGSIPENKLGIGSAMNDTTRELGGALSIAILGSLVNNRYIASITQSSISSDLKNEVSLSIQNAHIISQTYNIQSIIDVADQAFINALSYSLNIGAIVILIASIITYMYLPNSIKQSN